MPTHRQSLDVLTTSALAELVRKKPATVRRRLASAGLEPVRQDARSLWWSSFDALRVLFGATERLDLSAERAKLTAIQSERAALELGVRRGELVETRDVLEKLGPQIVAAKTHLLGLPSRLQSVLPHLTPADLAKVRELVKRALTEVADGAGLLP